MPQSVYLTTGKTSKSQKNNLSQLEDTLALFLEHPTEL